jgi:hypothetical protein
MQSCMIPWTDDLVHTPFLPNHYQTICLSVAFCGIACRSSDFRPPDSTTYSTDTWGVLLSVLFVSLILALFRCLAAYLLGVLSSLLVESSSILTVLVGLGVSADLDSLRLVTRGRRDEGRK